MESISSSVEEITHNGELIALVIRSGFAKPGLHFFTPDDFSQQLAYMQHPAGKVIEAHIHTPVPRAVSLTQEVLIIKRGRLRVDFYDTRHAYIRSLILGSGDVMLLASAGHGFEVIEDVEMIEVKQGPYIGDQDKVRFEKVSPERIHY